MGRVYQRKRDRGRPDAGSKLAGWYAEWRDEHGKRHRKRVADTRREAKELLAIREGEVAEITGRLRPATSLRRRIDENPMGRVYFVRCPATGLTKIGFTTGDPSQRVCEMQTGSASELRLLGSIPGDRRQEFKLHKRFAHRRVRGEWFDLSDWDVLHCGIEPAAPPSKAGERNG